MREIIIYYDKPKKKKTNNKCISSLRREMEFQTLPRLFWYTTIKLYYWLLRVKINLSFRFGSAKNQYKVISVYRHQKPNL